MRWAAVFSLGIFLALGACGDERRGKSAGTGGEGGAGGIGEAGEGGGGGSGEAGAGGMPGGSGGGGGDGGGDGGEEGPFEIQGSFEVGPYYSPEGARLALNGNFDEALVLEDDGRFEFTVEELPYRLTVQWQGHLADVWDITELAPALSLVPWFRHNQQRLDFEPVGLPDPLPPRYKFAYGHAGGSAGGGGGHINPYWPVDLPTLETEVVVLFIEFDENYLPKKYLAGRSSVMLTAGGAPQAIDLVFEEVETKTVQVEYELDPFTWDRSRSYWGALIGGAKLDVGHWPRDTTAVLAPVEGLFVNPTVGDAKGSEAFWIEEFPLPSEKVLVRPLLERLPVQVSPPDNAMVGREPRLEWEPPAPSAGIQVLEIRGDFDWSIVVPGDANSFEFASQHPSFPRLDPDRTYKWRVFAYPEGSADLAVTRGLEWHPQTKTVEWEFTVD